MLISPELRGDGLLRAGGCVLMYPKHSHIFLKEGWREGKPGGRWGKMAEESSCPAVTMAERVLCGFVPHRGHMQVAWKVKRSAPPLYPQSNRCLAGVRPCAWAPCRALWGSEPFRISCGIPEQELTLDRTVGEPSSQALDVKTYHPYCTDEVTKTYKI